MLFVCYCQTYPYCKDFNTAANAGHGSSSNGDIFSGAPFAFASPFYLLNMHFPSISSLRKYFLTELAGNDHFSKDAHLSTDKVYGTVAVRLQRLSQFNTVLICIKMEVFQFVRGIQQLRIS